MLSKFFASNLVKISAAVTARITATADLKPGSKNELSPPMFVAL